MKTFYKNIQKIKNTIRRGWIDEGVEDPKDTIASHSYSATLVGWSLAREEGLDADKVVKMLLVHDLIMAYVFDYLPSEDGFEGKKDEEAKALSELIASFPESIRSEAKSLLEELEAQETDEAKLAKECDKLETILQANAYDPALTEKFIKGLEVKISRESTKGVLDEL